MNILELVAFEDEEKEQSLFALELKLEEITDSTDQYILCSVGFSRKEIEKFSTNFHNIIVLNKPVRNQNHRLIIFLLHIKLELGKSVESWELCDKSEVFNKIDFHSNQKSIWMILQHIPKKLYTIASNHSPLDAKLVIQEETKNWGEIGTFLQQDIKRLYRENIEFLQKYYSFNLKSTHTVSSDNLYRSLLEKWKFCESYQSYKPNKEIKNLASYVFSLLRKCTTHKTYIPDYTSSFWSSLLAFSAGWYLRLSLVLHRNGEHSSSILSIVRAIELAMQSQLLHRKDCEFDDRKNNGYEFYLTGQNKEIRGAGNYVSYITRYSHSKDFEKRLRTILRIRNNSRLAHGTYCIDEDGFNHCLSESKLLIYEFLDDILKDNFNLSFNYKIPNLKQKHTDSLSTEIRSHFT